MAARLTARAAAVGALAVAAGGVVLSGAGPVRGRVALMWLLLAAVNVAFLVLAWRVARAPAAGPSTRRVWRGLAGAALAFVVGDAVQLVLVATAPRVTPAVVVGGPPQQVCVLAGTAALVLVVLLEPLRLGSRRDRARFWLDVGILLVTAATFGAWTTPSPTATGTFLRLVELLDGPALFLVGAFAVGKLALAPVRPFTRPAGVMLGLAGAAEALLQATAPALDARFGLVEVSLVNVPVNAMLVVAGALQLRAVRAGQGDVHVPPRRIGLLPFAAVVASNALLVHALTSSGLDGRGWVVVAGSVTGTALVMARQADLVLELHRALAERDRLAGRLREQAFRDPLTGLANRARFEEALEAALGAAPAAGFLLLVVDLDGFKPVNDGYGHASGDAVLVAVARRLRFCVREVDLVARTGGDEFALLVRGDGDTPPVEPDLVARRVVDAVAEPVRTGSDEPSAGGRGPVVHVGASVGGVVVTGPTRPRSTGDLLHRADEAMYEAKRSGKGRYVIHTV